MTNRAKVCPMCSVAFADETQGNLRTYCQPCGVVNRHQKHLAYLKTYRDSRKHLATVKSPSKWEGFYQMQLPFAPMLHAVLSIECQSDILRRFTPTHARYWCRFRAAGTAPLWFVDEILTSYYGRPDLFHALYGEAV